MRAQLRSKFGSEYEVTASDFGLWDKEWSHEIKIRKGSKIGAAISFKWEQSKPGSLAIEVDESSKMGTQITYDILLPFLLIGAYLAYNDMEPLAFLPGQKIAARLGGLLALIPGGILVFILKSVLLKGEKVENAKLVNEIKLAIKK